MYTGLALIRQTRSSRTSSCRLDPSAFVVGVSKMMQRHPFGSERSPHAPYLNCMPNAKRHTQKQVYFKAIYSQDNMFPFNI